MTYDNIFTAYYNLYRAEAVVPASTDDEYTIGMRLANEGLNRWANYDGMYWKTLFTTLQTDGGGSQVIVTGQTAYLAPSNFREAGGYVKVKDTNGVVKQSYGIIEPQEVQFKDPNGTFCYFTQGQNYYSTGTASQSGTTITGSGTTFTSAMTGMQIYFVTGETATVTYVSATSLTADVSQTVSSGTFKIINSGFTLNLNPAPLSSLNGLDIEYIYYKKPTEYTSVSTKSEIPDPYFIIHRMLANRFRASRNPYYTDAKADAENALQQMKMDNDSGSWANPWILGDSSGTVWGQDGGDVSFGGN